MKGAHNALLDLEELEEDDLDHIRADYVQLDEYARMKLRKRKRDTGVLELGIGKNPRKKKKGSTLPGNN